MLKQPRRNPHHDETRTCSVSCFHKNLSCYLTLWLAARIGFNLFAFLPGFTLIAS